MIFIRMMYGAIGRTESGKRYSASQERILEPQQHIVMAKAKVEQKDRERGKIEDARMEKTQRPWDLLKDEKSMAGTICYQSDCQGVGGAYISSHPHFLRQMYCRTTLDWCLI